MKKFYVPLVAAMTAMFLMLGTMLAFATVQTDQPDYTPGSVVTISGDNSNGAGYLAGEAVSVEVSGPNGYQASCAGLADNNGTWSCQVTLWDSLDAAGTYTYTAAGQTSGVSESGTFTDATQTQILSPAITPASPTTSDTLAFIGTLQYKSGSTWYGLGGKTITVTGPYANTGACSSGGGDTVNSGPTATTGTIGAFSVSLGKWAEGDRWFKAQFAVDGTYQKSEVCLMVTVSAPSDTTPPGVSIALTSPHGGTPDGNAPWFVSKPVAGTVTALDADTNISELSCSGVTLTDVTGVGTAKTATANFSISSEGTTNISCTAKDSASPANTSGAATDTVRIDTVNPVSSASGPNQVTNISPFTISYTASDAAPSSGLDKVELWVKVPGGSYALTDTDFTPTATLSFSYMALAGEGTYSFYTRAFDTAGNIEPVPAIPDAQVTVLYDTTKPVTTDNAPGGWQDESVTVTLTATDPLGVDPSGVAHTYYKVGAGSFTEGMSVLIGAPADHSNDGVHTISYYSTDNAGNIESTKTVDVRIDTTPPVIASHADVTAEATSALGAVVSYTSPATSDAVDGAGTATCAPASGTQFALSDTTVTCNATDVAGNAAVPTTFVVHVVDTTAPVLTLPANISTTATGNSKATVSYIATANDLVDGAVPVTCAPASGSEFSVGTTTVNCSATDAHLNTANGSFTVTVTYAFTGFFRPVDNIPVINRAKAGSAIPVKFSLGGNQGLNIFLSGYPTSNTAACGAAAEVDTIEQTVTAGGSSLNYDAAGNQYIYVWKTEKTWTGCRTLTVKFADGSVQRAYFQFFK